MSIVWSANQRGWYNPSRRVFDDPGSVARAESYLQRSNEYNLLWAYYNGSMFERVIPTINSMRTLGGWQTYKSNYNLYRNIRLIYNPTRRLVDFYASQVYPGVLSEDGAKLPDGVSLAIPFSEDTSLELKDAIAQFWTWSNWQAKKAVLPRYGAALGSVLVEVVDDVARGKVCGEIVWPGFVCDLDLDSAGNVRSYTLDYQAWDERGGYRYRKEVDINSIRYYRDDRLYDYGDGSVVENTYGFTPAVWIKHTDTGSLHGSPAISGSLGKMDELNNLVSHVHDQIHKIVEAPVVLWSAGGISNLFGNAKRGATEDEQNPTGDRESVQTLKGPQGGHVESLVGNLDLAAVGGHIDRLIGEIEQDHPELTYWRELRSMTQVTGPAASRLAGDVAGALQEAQAAYDLGSMRLFQMAVAIGGERLLRGDWPRPNKAQLKFAPFNLDSFVLGDLDMAIMPRPLMTPTKTEIAQERQAQWAGVSAAVGAGVPLEMALADEGWTDKQIAKLKANVAAQTPPQLAAPQAPPMTQAQQPMMPVAGQ